MREIDSDEVAQRLAIVERVLDRFVSQAIPLLETDQEPTHTGNAERVAMLFDQAYLIATPSRNTPPLS